MKKFLDYTVKESDLTDMSDKDISELLMFTDRDRAELPVAEKIYWWCVKEINRRIELEESTEGVLN